MFRRDPIFPFHFPPHFPPRCSFPLGDAGTSVAASLGSACILRAGRAVPARRTFVRQGRNLEVPCAGMAKVRDRGDGGADLTIRCESPSIVLTRLHGRPYGRPTGGTSGAGGLCVGLCPLPHKEDQCILSNNSSVRHLTAGTALSSPSC